jgi:hypothetical protein
MNSENTANMLQICKIYDPLIMLKLDFNERESAIRKKYFDLIRDSDSVTAAQVKPDPDNEQIL